MRGTLLFDEPMALHTALKVGGPADYFAVPADLAELQRLVTVLVASDIPYLLIGGGYNLLVRDGGFRGVVISLEALCSIDSTGDSLIIAGAGASNRALADYALKHSLSGIEFLAGIPGSLGGAVAMNAGAGGEAIADRLEMLTTLDNGAVTVTSKEKLCFGYRFLQLDPGEIIIGASLRLEPGSRSEIAVNIEAFMDQRRSSQQVGYPSAGSFFKNPPGKGAWRLIDEAGLRGYRVGGAQVSEVHANFLVNRGGAKAADFIAVADYIKQVVWKEAAVLLEEEVKIVGEN
jgi:UDP-N-acetylmuramate dehydrogenase